MGVLELLARAGDLERLKIACLYGADAVYFGGQNFSLRANALNFSLDDIAEAVKYAHSKRKKVYVTVTVQGILITMPEREKRLHIMILYTLWMKPESFLSI